MRIRTALRIWDEAVDPAGTIVEQYLLGRGLELGSAACHAIRFHPNVWLDGIVVPCMVALLRDIASDSPCGIHRTFLDDKGRKLERRMMGRAKGAAVKLDSDDAVTFGLGIAEGIETALSIVGNGWRPVWALGSAGGIERFPVLRGVEALTVFADADVVGAKAARVCAQRWADASVSSRVLTPPRDGTDWNDVRLNP